MKYLLIKLFLNYYKSKKFKKIDSCTLESLVENRIIEPEIILLDQFIKSGDYCFDIGSNKGQYIYKLNKLTQSEKIFAFEPIPKNYRFLKNIFPECKIFKYALSNEVGLKKMKIPIVNNRLLDTRAKIDFNILEKNETGYRTIKIECNTIDLFIKQNNVRKIDFLKIDVEGHEFDILKGGIQSIKTFRPIILIEIEQRHHPYNISRIFNFILKLKYEIKYYNLSTMKFELLENFDVNKNQNYNKIKTSDYVNNFFCIPK